MVTKSTFAPASPGFAVSRSCAWTSASSKIVPKAGERSFRGSFDVLRDRLRIRHDLVLIAGVELHVARLVHLLRCKEGGLLLRPVGPDQAGELRRDPLLGDDQRRQRPDH